MGWFDRHREVISKENGWIPLEDLFRGFRDSVQRTNQHLGESDETAEHHLVLKDFRMDFPAEVYVDPETNITYVRLPATARVLDERFDNDHLSRVTFSFGVLFKEQVP